MMERKISIKRKTDETNIELDLNLAGSGIASVSTGLGFLDHLFDTLTKHSRMNLTLTCDGDLMTDDHHTAEDCGIALGQALDGALGDRAGIRRFGFAYAPLDESLARAVVDVSGRPYSDVNLGLRREKLGELACENVCHILQSLAYSARITLHVDVLKGENDHHRAEAAFKAFAVALRDAISSSGTNDVPSTKGTIERGVQ